MVRFRSKPELRLAFAILRAVSNRYHDNLLADFVHPVNNDVGPLQKLARALDETGASNMGELTIFEPHDLGFIREITCAARMF